MLIHKGEPRIVCRCRRERGSSLEYGTVLNVHQWHIGGGFGGELSRGVPGGRSSCRNGQCTWTFRLVYWRLEVEIAGWDDRAIRAGKFDWLGIEKWAIKE